MNKNKMLVKQLSKEVKQGKSKTEAFKTYLDAGGDEKKGASCLSMLPDQDLRLKYQKQTFALLYIYLFFVLLGLAAAIPLFMELGSIGATIGVIAFALAIPAIVTWAILMGDATGYFIFVFFMLHGISGSFDDYALDPMGSWIGAGINLALIVWALSIKKKIFPYQNLFSSRKDANGVAIFTAQPEAKTDESSTLSGSI